MVKKVKLSDWKKSMKFTQCDGDCDAELENKDTYFYQGGHYCWDCCVKELRADGYFIGWTANDEKLQLIDDL